MTYDGACYYDVDAREREEKRREEDHKNGKRTRGQPRANPLP